MEQPQEQTIEQPVEPAEKKPLSRQRLWQIANVAAGKCELCSSKLFTKSLCLRHYRRQIDRVRMRKMRIKKYAGKYSKGRVDLDAEGAIVKPAQF